ncbi:MAG: LysR substrate-binding domain-containing protein [Kofleriaceae bacterium]
MSLRAFVAVARHRSFRGAATELGLSPSALSHSITMLEKELGVRLFHRTTRSVALSDAGEHLLARVTPALAQIAEAVATVEDFRAAPRGTLRINTSVVPARLIMLPLVREFLGRYPGVEVELAADDRLVDIVAEGFDAGVRSAELVPRDMIAIPCSPPVRFAIAAAPAYVAAHGVPRKPEDLLSHDCVRHKLAGNRHFAWELERGKRRYALNVKGRLVVGTDELARDAVLAGLGLGYFSEWTIADDLAAGRLVRVLEGWFPQYERLCLYYSSHRHVPATLRAFVDLISERRNHRSVR